MSEEGTQSAGKQFLDKFSMPPEVDRVSHEIIGAAIEVHRLLGPGFLESVYHQAMIHEMTLREIAFRSEVPMTIQYKDVEIGGQKLDLIVQPGVVVELKAVDAILPIHTAQLLSYLKSTGCRLGLLINFKVTMLKDGIRRIAN